MKLRFSILKDYSYIKRYAVRKLSMLERLLTSLSPKKKVEQEEVRAVEEKKVEAKGIDVIAAKAVPVVILLAFIVFGYVKYLELAPLFALAEQQQVSFNANPLFSHYVTSGTITDNRVAFLQALELSNASSFKVTPYFLTAPISGQVYLFYNPQYQSSFVKSLADSLESSLSSKGFSFTVISSMAQLANVPKGAVVIFPSDSLLPGFTENAEELSKRGALLFVVAKNPSFELTSSGISKPVSSFWTLNGVSFVVSDKEVPSLKLRFISYEVPGASQLLGAGQYLTTESGLRLLFLPASAGADASNYWESAEDAASDITSILEELITLSTREETQTYALSNSSIVYLDFNPKRNEPTPEVLNALTLVEVADSKKYVFSEVSKDFPGSAYFQQAMPILPYGVSKRDSIIKLLLDPSSEGVARVRMLLIDELGRTADEVEVNFLEPIQKSVPFDFTYRNEDLPEGRYLVLFKDANTGEVYAKTLLELGQLNVSATPNFEEAKINFTFLVSGRPTYVGRATIRYGDKVEKTFTNVRSATLDLSNIFGGAMPAGTYEFEVSVEGSEEPIVVSVRRAPRTGLTTFFTNPVNLFIIFLSIGIRLIGELLKRKEELPYSIDVPDFAPVDYETIEVTPEQVLQAFELVNKYYKWELTPLSLEEVKKGIGLVLDNPNLVLNDFNVEILLEDLVSKGLILHVGSYYLPKRWLDKGFTAEQLVSFRMIRDLCVDLAIPFKKLSKSLPNTKLSLPWQEFWVYLYSPYNREAIKYTIIKNLEAPGVAHAIVFFDEDDMDKFENSLNDGTYSSALLRSYIDNEKVYMFTIQELVETLKEVKS